MSPTRDGLTGSEGSSRTLFFSCLSLIVCVLLMIHKDEIAYPLGGLEETVHTVDVFRQKGLGSEL